MDYAKDLIAEAREKRRINSDAALANELGVTAQTLNQWKLGTVPLPAARAARLAKMAGRNEAVAYLEHQLAYESDELLRTQLRGLLELAKRAGKGAGLKARRTLAALFFAFTATLLPPQQANAAQSAVEAFSRPVYIMSLRRRPRRFGRVRSSRFRVVRQRRTAA